MKYGKRVCQSLKVVRKQIADANEIPYEITECPHQGNCPGTCPKCESELRYIENQLSLRRAAGKAISLVGLSLGISATFSACGTNTNSQPKEPEPIQKTDSIEIEDEGEIVMPLQKDSASVQSTKAEVPPMPDVIEGQVNFIDGDIEIEEVEMNSLDEDEYVDNRGTSTSDLTISNLDKQPEFPGGEAALMAFIKYNMKYPAFASENGIQGFVTLSFIIENDGSISYIKVMQSPAEELSEEAIRIVQQMPKWKPRTVKGKAVSTLYVLPITFRLQ